MKTQLSRRHFLRAAGSLIALPALESIGFRTFASEKAVTRPKRMIFLGMGFGVTQETWFPDPKRVGTDYILPDGLAPLSRHQKDITVIQGLSNKYSQDAHWGSTFWLTGANRFAEPGQSFHNTISADQVAAATISQDTRFASIQLNGGDPDLVGHHQGHGPGLSLAWDAGGKPVAGLDSPALLFHRLYSPESMSLAERQALIAQDRSVLDAVLSDAKQLQRGLTKSDNDKLNEYFQSIREIETRIAKDEQWLGIPKPKAPIEEPPAKMRGKEEVKLMYDLMAAAFQTDSTRVFTYRQPSEEFVKSLGAKVAVHDMSHYAPGERMEVSQLRDRAQSELLAGLIDRLKSIREPDGSTLFDHTCIAYGSNLRTVHTLENCPTVIAGGGAGVKMGHHLVVEKHTPLCNLWLTLLRGVGVDAERHGDSSGIIPQLGAS
jgi:hypothetical protein